MDIVELQVNIKGEFRVYAMTLIESEEIQHVLDTATDDIVEIQLESLLKDKKLVAFSKTGSFDAINQIRTINNYKH